MDLLFATNSWWNWDAESTFARLREENPELVQAARRTGSVADPESQGGRRKSVRGPSLVPGGRDEVGIGGGIGGGSETGSEEKGGVGELKA